MTAADRPSVTDNARAEAEKRWPRLYGPEETLTYPREAVREHTRGGFVAGYKAGWAAGRAETTTAHECDSGDFDRTLPTREQIIDALVMSPLSDTAGTDMRPFEQTADAVLALLRGGDE